MKTWKELISFLMDTPVEHWRSTEFVPSEHLVYERPDGLTRVCVWLDAANGWTLTLNCEERASWYFHAGEVSTPKMLDDIEALHRAKRGGTARAQAVVDARVAYAMGVSDDYGACYTSAGGSYQR